MDRISWYRRAAEEAEVLAATAKDPQLKTAWKRIAESYRELASLKANLRSELRNSRL